MMASKSISWIAILMLGYGCAHAPDRKPAQSAASEDHACLKHIEEQHDWKAPHPARALLAALQKGLSSPESEEWVESASYLITEKGTPTRITFERMGERFQIESEASFGGIPYVTPSISVFLEKHLSGRTIVPETRSLRFQTAGGEPVSVYESEGRILRIVQGTEFICEFEDEGPACDCSSLPD